MRALWQRAGMLLCLCSVATESFLPGTRTSTSFSTSHISTGRHSRHTRTGRWVRTPASTLATKLHAATFGRASLFLLLSATPDADNGDRNYEQGQEEEDAKEEEEEPIIDWVSRRHIAGLWKLQGSGSGFEKDISSSLFLSAGGSFSSIEGNLRPGYTAFFAVFICFFLVCLDLS